MIDIQVFLLLTLPFIGAVLSFVLGKWKKELAFYSAYIVSMTLFIVTLMLFFSYSQPLDFEIQWFTFGKTTLPFGIYIDHLSLIMLLIATGLGALDIHFSHDYMKQERDQSRYYAKMLFFLGGMILLVSAKELIGLFVGWEFMGLASYLLISFWHYEKDPADAGVSAFLYTKFGDIFLFASLGILYYTTATLDMVTLNTLATEGKIESSVMYMVALFIFIAAIGKSGQFPLFPWLMRAMEGPTTVSALIHGATMVNSGIYIVARLFDFYVASEALIVVAGVASLSAFIGATSALVQKEMKKVLAYSTMSHLSLAFIGLGAGSFAAGMGHLVNHAVFKALLFLSVGAVIMASHHTKDIWRLGGLKNRLFFIGLFMGMGVLSLSGVAPFSGFYSKDAILLATMQNQQTFGLISTLTFIAAVLSIAYGGRMWVLMFLGEPREKVVFESVKEPSFFWIGVPLGIMAFLTLGMGFYYDDIIVFLSGKAPETLHINTLLISVVSILLVLALLIYFFYYKRSDLRDKVASQPLMKTIHQVLFNGYYVENIVYYIAHNIVVKEVAKTIAFVEKNVIDKVVNGMVVFMQATFHLGEKTHTYKVSSQVSIMLFGMIVIMVFFIVRSAL